MFLFSEKLWERSRTWTPLPLTGWCPCLPLWNWSFLFPQMFLQGGHVCCFPGETLEHWNHSHQVEPWKLWQGSVIQSSKFKYFFSIKIQDISHGWWNQVTASSFCRRRLPVLMVRSKMAESVKSAVQVITSPITDYFSHLSRMIWPFLGLQAS